MITNRRTLFLGIFIVLIPFLGFPSSWKTFMIIVSGLVLAGFSINITIPKKIPKRTFRRREIITPIFQESIIIQPSTTVRKEKQSEQDTTEIESGDRP